MIRTLAGGLRRLIRLWALGGGLLLLAVVAVNALSALGTLVGAPIPGDLELTEMGVAVAVFAFLPWCQIARAHVGADIFTVRVPPAARRHLDALACAAALGIAAVLLWRMSAGMADQRSYGATTAILQIPHWAAFVPILASLALWAAAALLTLSEDLRPRHE